MMLAPISPKFRYIFWDGEESKEGREEEAKRGVERKERRGSGESMEKRKKRIEGLK